MQRHNMALRMCLGLGLVVLAAVVYLARQPAPAASPVLNVPRAARAVIWSGSRAQTPGRGRLVTAARLLPAADGHVPRTGRVVFRSGSRAMQWALAAGVSDLRHTPVRVWVDRSTEPRSINRTRR